MNPATLSDPSGLAPLVFGGTKVAGVIGWPIEHSVSPPMHNAAFRALGLDWCYVPFAVHPSHLEAAMRGVKALGMRGINATVPHKQALLSLVDALTPAARAIGAVNTVIVKGEALIGHNTDAAGFLRALRDADYVPDESRALVLGAGGAARAVVYALASVGAQVTILNRTPKRAEVLAHELVDVNDGARLSARTLSTSTLQSEAPGAQLVVNATPLGMWPDVDSSPWPEGVAFPPEALLFDLVYNPRETLLMRQARHSGASAVDGLRMLVHQGAEAFELWTERDAPVEAMYAACTRTLGGE